MRAIGLVLALLLLSASVVAWAGENLVPNASFELGRWSPSLYGMDNTRHWLEVDTRHLTAGRHALELRLKESRGPGRGWYWGLDTIAWQAVN